MPKIDPLVLIIAGGLAGVGLSALAVAFLVSRTPEPEPTTVVPPTAVATEGRTVELPFSEDFETDLSRWTDGPYRAHSAEIVADPLNPRNHAMRFTRLGAGGDLASLPIRRHGEATYRLTFDYLGIPSSGATPENLGGAIGYSRGVPRTEQWLAATHFDYAPTDMPDDGKWHSYEFTFHLGENDPPGDGGLRILLEDFENSRGHAGDAYFDNIVLERVPAR
jgi:hypothetical protein